MTRYLTATAVLATAVLAAACSSSATHDSSPPDSPGRTLSGSSPTGSSPSVPVTSEAGDPPATVDVCALLPAATLSTLTGAHFTKATRGKLPPSVPISSCTYTGGISDQLNVSVIGMASDYAFEGEYKSNKSVIKSTARVSGIGDKAFTANFPSMWLDVLWGGEELRITGATTVSVANAKKVITALHAKL